MRARLFRSRLDFLLPPAVIVGFAVLIWRLFGVTIGDAALFIAYVTAYTLVPGCAVFVALTRPERIGLREVALGWGLGYGLEVGFFALTAATGTRDLFALYPVAVVLVTAPRTLPLLRATLPSQPPRTTGWAWGIALVACAAISYLAETFFTKAPLPWEAAAVSYYADVVWNIAMAAEALHHWPLEVPSLAGVPLRYHYFADIDAAAASQVTGIPLSLMLLRLTMVPLTVLAVAQFVVLARSLGGSAWAGVLAAAMFMLAAFPEPVPSLPSEFLVRFPLSPSFLYGLVVFLPLLTLLSERLTAQGADRRGRRGTVAVAVLLMAASAGGKATILPVFGGAIAIVLLVAWRRRLPHADTKVVLGAGALTAAVLVAFQLTMYAGGSNSFTIKPFQLFGEAQPFELLLDELGRSAPVVALLGLVAVPLGTLKLIALLVPGLAALVLMRRLDGPRVLMLGALLAGLVPIWLLTHPGLSQFYFFFYGFAAATAVSAVGLTEAARSAFGHVAVRPAIVTGAIVLVLAAWLAETPAFKYRAVYQALDGTVTYSQENNNLTPALHDGLRWVEGNTSPSAIVAVSNRYSTAARNETRYCYFTAFAERRAMAECSYDGTSTPYGALDGDVERLQLNDAIFGAADRAALRTAVERYGVDYLLVDRLHGATAPGVGALGRKVFENAALIVLDVRDAA